MNFYIIRVAAIAAEMVATPHLEIETIATAPSEHGAVHVGVSVANRGVRTNAALPDMFLPRFSWSSCLISWTFTQRMLWGMRFLLTSAQAPLLP